MFEEEEIPLTQSLNTFQSSLNDMEDEVRETQSTQLNLEQQIEMQCEQMRQITIQAQESQDSLDSLEEKGKTARDCLERSSLIMKKVQNKQHDVNEKINSMMKAYDSNFLINQNVKDDYNKKVSVLDRFLSIQKQDIDDVNNVGSSTMEIYRTNFEEKQILHEQIKDIESSDESLDEQMSSLDNHLGSLDDQFENFKKTFSELKKQGEIAIYKSKSMKSTIEQIEIRANLNIEEWNVKWRKEDENLNEIKRSFEQYLSKIDQAKCNYKKSSNHVESESRRAQSLQQCLEEARKEIRKDESEIANLLKSQKERQIVDRHIEQLEKPNFEIKKIREELLVKIKMNDDHISSLNCKLDQLLNYNLTNQEKIDEIESAEELEAYLLKQADEIAQFKAALDEKNKQKSDEAKSLKEMSAEGKAQMQAKRVALKEITNNRKSVNQQLENIKSEIDKELNALAILDKEAADIHKLKEKQQSLIEEREHYYNLYNATLENLKKREKEIEEAVLFNNQLTETNVQIESLIEENLNKVKDELEKRREDLQNSKAELHAKVNEEKELMSKIQYDYYTAKNAVHEGQKELATLRAMSEIAKFENESVKAFLNWISNGIQLSKYTGKESGFKQEKDEFPFSQLLSQSKLSDGFGSIKGSQEMELEETDRRLEELEKSQLASTDMDPPKEIYDRNKFMYRAERDLGTSSSVRSIVNLISEDQVFAPPKKVKIQSTGVRNVVNLVSEEEHLNTGVVVIPKPIMLQQNQTIQSQTSKVQPFQSQAQNTQNIQKPTSTVKDSKFKVPQAKTGNRIFKSADRNPFSLFSSSMNKATSRNSLKHTYKPTMPDDDDDAENNPYLLFASPKAEVSSSSSKKTPKAKGSQNKSSQSSQKPRKKPTKKTTAIKKKDFNEEAHKEILMSYIQSVQKKDSSQKD